jgi:hypothetical protein
MRRARRTLSISCAAAFCAAVLAGPSAKANLITRFTGFGAEEVTIDTPGLAAATTFKAASPFTTTDSGTRSLAPLMTDVPFNPPAASLTPLWTFDIGSIVYSFDATILRSYYNSSLEQWDIGGYGMATITGYTAPDGTWNANVGQGEDIFVFDASEPSTGAAVMTDSASTMPLLGSAFLGLLALGRRFNC